MEKISIIIILLIIAGAIFVIKNIASSENKNLAEHFTSNKKSRTDDSHSSSLNPLISCSPFSCSVTAKNIKTGKTKTKDFDFDDLQEGEEWVFGRKTGTESDNKLWFPLDCVGRVTSREHFALFKQIDSYKGEKVTRFGVCDTNSKCGTFVRNSENEDWVRTDVREIKDNYQVKAGEYIFTFHFVDFFDNKDSSDVDNDEDVKIFKSKKKMLPTLQ